MKNYVILFALMLLPFLSQAQDVYKYKTTSLAVKLEQDSKFSKPDACSIIIVVNFEAERVYIFSKEDQVFDVVEFGDKKTDSDGDEYFAMRSVDKDGIICTLYFYSITNDRNDRKQLYVHYSNMSYVYNMYSVN